MVERISRRLFLAGATRRVLAACGDDGGEASGSSTTSTSASSSTSGATSSTTSVPSSTAGVSVPEPEPVDLPGDVFALGVASGDPLTDRVVLWTRLVVDPLVVGGGMLTDDVALTWEVARRDDFADVVAAGTVTAEASHAHAVHVDAGGLEADTAYAYRFRVGDQVSPTGHTRTLAADGTDPFSLVVATCQDPQFGEYGAWREVASRDDVDAVLFTGDYIYELPAFDVSPAGDGRRMWSSPPPADLDGFRLRYGEVKSDPALQAAHARFPWWLMWDDHEITDNYWSGGPGMFDAAGGDFAARRAAAYQAWREHQPVRLAPPVDGELAIHRSVRIGDLAELFLIDTRQYADEPPCRDTSALDLGVACAERDDPASTLLGAEQESWLLDGLTGADARWTALVSPCMFAGLDARGPDDTEPKYYLEAWDGYPAARERVADALAAAPNPVVLSGDYHASFALEVGPAFGRDVFAPEFMSTAISSSPFAAEVRPANPHVRHFAGDNGYLLCRVAADTFTAEYRTVTDVWDPSSPVQTTARFVVDAGSPALRDG